jgi:hypothetical protein
MSMTDLDAEIVALRVSGASERENCLRFGCTMGRVRAVLDTHAERVLAPENVLRVLIDGLGDLNAIERVFAPKARAGDAEAAKLVKQARRQRERHAKLILQRAPTSNPV